VQVRAFRSVGLALIAVAIVSLASLQAVYSQVLPQPGQTDVANIELVITNLGNLLDEADQIRQNGKLVVPTPGEKAHTQINKDLTPYIQKFKDVRDNLRRKLRAPSGIHPIPRLKDKTTGAKYSPTDPNKPNFNPSNPRAAFCVRDTFVLINGAWVACPEGDIIIDGGISDPRRGQAIDETTNEGWEQKWTLLHILVHEKWHERIFDEAIDELHKALGWSSLPQKAKETREAATIAKALDEKSHQNVLTAQEDVLWIEWDILRRRLKNLEVETEEYNNVKRKMKWIEDQIKNIEAHKVHDA
jgi:hypothetical protein